MAELKTKASGASVAAFLKSIADDQVREDCAVVADIMAKVTKATPKMWGSRMVGYGSYRYKYASGREGEWMLTAYAPGKGKFTVYVMPGYEGLPELRKKLGKHSGGMSCIHIRRLSDVHVPTLRKMITESVKHLKKIGRP
jgi:hypothetical protein